MTSSRLQSQYFDQLQNRYSADRLLHPPLAQQLELEHLASFLPPSANRIVDFGCGSGRVTIYFLKRGYDVLGVDVSPASLRDLSSFYRRHKTAAWGRLTLSAALPIRPVVSAIVGADVLHHVPLREILPQLRRCLRPGGILAFSEPNAFYPLWYFHYFLGHIPWAVEKGILQCTPSNLSSLFRQAGFSNIRIYAHGILPTRIFNSFPNLCRLNALIPARLSFLSNVSFRLMLTAVNSP